MTDRHDICVLFKVSEGLRKMLSGNRSTVQTIKRLAFHEGKCFRKHLYEVKDLL